MAYSIGAGEVEVLAMNLSGRFKGREIQLLGERVINTILTEKSIGVFFGQQTNFLPEFPEGYSLVGGTKAFLVYDNRLFRAFDDKRFRDKLKDLQLMGKLPFHYLPYQNYAICKLQSRRDPSMEFIAMSWVTDECFGYMRSASMLKKLSLFISNLSLVEELPVIVAGSFRVAFDDACDLLPEDLSCFSYQPKGPRRALRASTYFITTRSAGVYNVEPVVTANIDLSMDHGPGDHWLNPEDAFYCDPVLATLDLQGDNLSDASREDATGGSQGDVADGDVKMDDGIPNGIHQGRRASSYQNLYYDEDMLDNTMLCTIS